MSFRDTTTYNLYSTERIFKDSTLISYYFKPNRKIIKKFIPYDIDGERYRLNLETGEYTPYKKKDILISFGASLRRTVILINTLLEMNDFDWFWTLTFDKAKIDRTNDEQVFKCYERYINNIKKQYPDFKYMCFPERHEDGCFHFHLLTAGLTVAQMGLVNSGNVCCHWAKKKNKYGILENIGNCSKSFYEKTKHSHELRDTDGEPIYNITTFAYGITTVSRIVSRERCNSYVKKYVEKDLGSTDFYKKRFYYSSNLNTPAILKKLIGADFNNPTDIENLPLVMNSPYVKASDGMNISYGVLQVKLDNRTKQLIDKGFTPLSKEELASLDAIF